MKRIKKLATDTQIKKLMEEYDMCEKNVFDINVNQYHVLSPVIASNLTAAFYSAIIMAQAQGHVLSPPDRDVLFEQVLSDFLKFDKRISESAKLAQNAQSPKP